MAWLPIEMIATRFYFAFYGLGDTSTLLARNCVISFSRVDSNATGLEEIIVFGVHSVGSDDVDGFLKAIWVACALDFADDFGIAQVLLEAVDEAAQ